ncbi:hypothetical protein Tco_0461816 [Tanacetum coccineum]
MIPEFRDTLIHHMESVEKSIDERAQHKREYDSWVNERQIQITEEKVDTSKALDARQQHTEQPEFNNEGEVDQNAEQCDDTWKLVLQPHRNQSVVRQPTAFKSKRPRISKPRFASQVDVNNDLSKPVTTHYLPKERESAVAKLHHMIAPGLSSTTKVDSDPTNGSNKDITNQYDCEQTLDGFKEFLSDEQAMTSDHNSSELGIHDHNNEPSSSKLVPKVVPLEDKTAISQQELELLFHHHITMLRSVLNVRIWFSFFLQMGFTLILATLDGLDVGLLGDVIGEDDCDDNG